MAIPDYQSLMLPMLRRLQDEAVHSIRDLADALAMEFKLSPQELEELLPSGRQRTFDNRVGWARTYMSKAGLVESPKRGLLRITDRGREVLARNPAAIDNRLLREFDEFNVFQGRGPKTADRRKDGEDNPATPSEQLEANYQELRSGLADELLSTVLRCSPAFFERLVVDLIVAMGYGGSHADAGQALGKGGRDEGIDGVIKEDRLGLDTVYLQAKRWNGPVGRPVVQGFVGSLEGQKARKGIMITTSHFTPEALAYSKVVEKRVVLIGGAELAQLMIDNGVGVTTVTRYEVKRIDSDYFEDDV